MENGINSNYFIRGCSGTCFIHIQNLHCESVINTGKHDRLNHIIQPTRKKAFRLVGKAYEPKVLPLSHMDINIP